MTTPPEDPYAQQPQQPQYPPQYPPPAAPPYGQQPQYAQYPPAYAGQYPGHPIYGAPGQQPGNGLAVAGMVCGIIGIVFFWVPVLCWILAILAVTFGGIGIARANNGASGKGMGIAGVVLGVITLGLYIIVVIAVIGSTP